MKSTFHGMILAALAAAVVLSFPGNAAAFLADAPPMLESGVHHADRAPASGYRDRAYGGQYRSAPQWSDSGRQLPRAPRTWRAPRQSWSDNAAAQVPRREAQRIGNRPGPSWSGYRDHGYRSGPPQTGGPSHGWRQAPSAPPFYPPAYGDRDAMPMPDAGHGGPRFLPGTTSDAPHQGQRTVADHLPW